MGPEGVALVIIELGAGNQVFDRIVFLVLQAIQFLGG